MTCPGCNGTTETRRHEAHLGVMFGDIGLDVLVTHNGQKLDRHFIEVDPIEGYAIALVEPVEMCTGGFCPHFRLERYEGDIQIQVRRPRRKETA